MTSKYFLHDDQRACPRHRWLLGHRQCARLVLFVRHPDTARTVREAPVNKEKISPRLLRHDPVSPFLFPLLLFQFHITFHCTLLKKLELFLFLKDAFESPFKSLAGDHPSG